MTQNITNSKSFGKFLLKYSMENKEQQVNSSVFLKLLNIFNKKTRNEDKVDIITSYLTFTKSYDMINAFLTILKRTTSEEVFDTLIHQIYANYLYNIDNAIKKYPMFNSDFDLFYYGVIFNPMSDEKNIQYTDIVIDDFVDKIILLFLYCPSLNLDMLVQYDKKKFFGETEKKLYFIKLLVKYIEYMRKKNKIVTNGIDQKICYLLDILKNINIRNYNNQEKTMQRSFTSVLGYKSYKAKLENFSKQHPNCITKNFKDKYENELMKITNSSIEKALSNVFTVNNSKNTKNKDNNNENTKKLKEDVKAMYNAEKTNKLRTLYRKLALKYDPNKAPFNKKNAFTAHFKYLQNEYEKKLKELYKLGL